MTQAAGEASTTEAAEPVWTFPAVGRWGLSVLPAGWTFVAGFGIRQLVTDPNGVAASVALGEDALATEDGLNAYIAAQRTLIQGQIPNAGIAGPQPSTFPGAEEAALFMVRHRPEGLGDMLHVQTYARLGLWVGIITFTTAEATLRQARPDYEGFLKGLRILLPEAEGTQS